MAMVQMQRHQFGDVDPAMLLAGLLIIKENALFSRSM
jgi:hypothetical protein